MVGFRRVARKEGEEKGEEGESQGSRRIDEGADVEEEGLVIARG